MKWFKYWFLSIIFFSTIAIFKFVPPSKSLGGWGTDHFSHWASAIFFAQKGWDIYRFPTSEICPVSTDEAVVFAHNVSLNPDVFCLIPNAHSTGEPGFINWPWYPRAYPPGAFLYASVEALLNRAGLVSFANINLISILKYVLVAHFAFLAFLLCLYSPAKPLGPGLIILLAVIFSDLVNYSLEGFYDVIAVLFVVLVFLQLQRKRVGLSVLFYSLAVFFHFRAVWWIVSLVPGLLMLDKTQLKSRVFWICMFLSAILFGFAGYSLYLVLPALKTFPINNPHHLTKILADPFTHLPFVLAMSGVVIFLLWKRCWLFSMFVVWQAYMVVMTPEVRSWHRLFLLPIFCVPIVLEQEKKNFYLGVAVVVFAIEFIGVFEGPCPFFWGTLGLF